jgi:hypothetical protein
MQNPISVISKPPGPTTVQRTAKNFEKEYILLLICPFNNQTKTKPIVARGLHCKHCLFQLILSKFAAFNEQLALYKDRQLHSNSLCGLLKSQDEKISLSQR